MISQGAGGKTLVALTAPAIWTGSSGGNATLKFLVTSQNCNQPCGRGGWLNVCHRSLTSLIPPLLWETAHLSRESFSRLGSAAECSRRQEAGEPGISQTLCLQEGPGVNHFPLWPQFQTHRKDTKIGQRALIPQTIGEQRPTQ